MKECNILGIDLAKNIFHICIMNRFGKVKRRAKVKRSNLVDYVVKHCEGVVAMEACGGANYFARKFEEIGFEVRQIPAQFVKKYVKSIKNDHVDAEAICEAASRGEMRFVSTKSEEQQDIQSLHRIRERLVRQRTAIVNETRGLLLEYGIVIAKGINNLRSTLHSVIEKHSPNHSNLWKETFLSLYEEFKELEERIKHYDKRLNAICATNKTCKRLIKVNGIGVLTATALVADVANPKDFKNGRQFSASLGLTPRQNSTGGRQILGSITKRGDKYIRKLLFQGASSFAISIINKHKQDKELNLTEKWFLALYNKKGRKKAVVALANKTARKLWHVLNGEDFKQQEDLVSLAV